MNKKESPIVLAIFYILIIGLLLLPLMFIKDLKCSKAHDTCSIYNKNILLNKTELVAKFSISDLDTVGAREISGRRGTHGYRMFLFFKTRSKLDTGIRTMSEKRVFKIYKEMISKENYELKGNYWKTLWGCY